MKPGDIITTWSDLPPRSGEAVVLATSRHKARVSPPSNHAGIERWFSVTQAQIDAGEHPEEVDRGSFYSEGWGAAWVEVAHLQPDDWGME